MYKIFVLLLVIIASVLGCSRQAPDQSADTGNRQTAQEANKLLTANQPTDDQVNTTIEQVAIDDSLVRAHDTMLAVYSIMMLWGQIPPSPADTTPVYDWSGNASVNGVGRYAVVSPIDFEPGLDYLLPVSDPTTIAWHSTTDSDIDGLATLLVMRRDVQYVVEPHFVFSTGMASLDVPISRLEKFDTLIMVNNRQALAIKAWRIYRPVCPKGTVTGEWVRFNNNGDSGTFRGTFNMPDGTPAHEVIGKFWTDPDGNRYLEGWWSGGMLTVIAGEVKGTWSFLDPSLCPMCGVGYGEFHGTWRTVLSDRHSGDLRGVFGIGPGPGATKMPFHGVWREDCETPTDQVN
ncbi:hypothetical protein C3F09_07095 [candidate division GN15 bacterium]|uniref:Uncharacterized protein n=1 Tax=candidate division GN15 bacterium TaxID=2072418 RepID=A0A855X187_9BACT|nr:MAG: hypothetical protein C3F09_07095 [candidate division GN15 bacterium]